MNADATRGRTWRPGPRVSTALFMALVVTLLGAVPGWETCAACWLVFSWLVLGCVICASLAAAIAAAVGRDWPGMRADARRALNAGLLMLVMVPLHELTDWLDLAASGATLLSRAQASVRAGGPRLAMTTEPSSGVEARGGLVYDPDGVIAPRFRQAEVWREHPVVVALSGDCVAEHHLIGPWYRWREDCDAL